MRRFSCRGLPEDFDMWAADGNQGWSSKDVMPFFLEVESDRDFGDDFHSKNGPQLHLPRLAWYRSPHRTESVPHNGALNVTHRRTNQGYRDTGKD